jgi:hypothetical protein
VKWGKKVMRTKAFFQAMKAYRRVKVLFDSFLTPAAFPLGRNPGCHGIEGWEGPRAPLEVIRIT